jgi:CO dehydrogenase/acetyl-CoA synthase beta subunit
VSVEAAPEMEEAAAVTTIPLPTTAIAAGGFKIILKNAKIHAEKLIIRSEKKQEKR